MKSPRPACRLVALLGIGAVVLAAPAIAQDCPELVGRWPYGPASAIAVSGGRAYLGSGAGLLVLDVSSPAAPVKLGEVPLPDGVQGVAVAGGYASVTRPTASSRVAFAPQRRSALTADHVG